MKKGDRIRVEGLTGEVIGESGFVNVFRNKLIKIKIDGQPNAIFLKDETELELI